MAGIVESGWGIIALIGAAVLLFNVALIYSLLSGSAQQQIDMIRRAAQRARHPWRRGDQALEELHQRVARLSAANSDPPDDD